MPEHVWITTAFHSTDIPSVEKYELIKKSSKAKWDGDVHSVTVKCRGSTRIIRKAVERKFFFDEKSLRAYLRKYIENQIKQHEGALERLRNLDGCSFYEVPPDKPNFTGPIQL